MSPLWIIFNAYYKLTERRPLICRIYAAHLLVYLAFLSFRAQPKAYHSISLSLLSNLPLTLLCSPDGRNSYLPIISYLQIPEWILHELFISTWPRSITLSLSLL